MSYLVLRSRIRPSELTRTDLTMVISAMSHSRVDDREFLECLFEEVGRREGWQLWERVNMAWVVAHLYLKGDVDDDGSSHDSVVFDVFVNSTVRECLEDLPTLHSDTQASANIVWALTVLSVEGQEATDVIISVFEHTERVYLSEGMEREHAHQLFQTWFMNEGRISDRVSREFVDFLEAAWEEEKSRLKRSSRSHLQVSRVLSLMGIRHRNEHDEDIDVAIVLDNGSGWSRVDSEGTECNGSTFVAVEYDGPDHFTYNGKKSLGHTNLKYRVLRKKGWAVVRVPYYVWDRIPFWASMERQRYLQRLLKTDKEIR